MSPSSLRVRSKHLVWLVTLAFAAPAAGVACGDGAERACRVGADCASGACAADGTCVPLDDATSPVPSADAGAIDAAPSADASRDADVPGCVPNHDGTITRDEVPIAAGLHATYRIGQNEVVDTAGQPRPDGTRAWDFSAKFPSDQDAIVETLPLAGTWYAPAFAGATYASKLSAASNLLGVFEVSPGALSLRGVVSPTDGAAKTQLTNAPPVTVLAFPLAKDKTWTSDATVQGTATGVLSLYTEHYDSQIDAAGDLTTPLGTFPVLRVRVVLTRTVGALVTITRTFAFVTECYGTIATVTSQIDEPAVEFTNAAEIRRIAP